MVSAAAPHRAHGRTPLHLIFASLLLTGLLAGVLEWARVQSAPVDFLVQFGNQPGDRAAADGDRDQSGVRDQPDWQPASVRDPPGDRAAAAGEGHEGGGGVPTDPPATGDPGVSAGVLRTPQDFFARPDVDHGNMPCGLLEDGYRYEGDPFLIIPGLSTAEGCCALCASEPRCGSWTWVIRGPGRRSASGDSTPDP
ncbi:unnamed protein product [Prorocentrum cordatum]|uniref:Apple domain-containing protein n=1 Tax=Prorocentrum cordatum TaxID=2364126 RepID=A0ABN9VQM2_9DINO|nr:unnamed protein product [Polarella glacialis]